MAEVIERCYYLHDFSDEVMPCSPSVEGWAEWLSMPDPEWQREVPAADGSTFKSTVLRFERDIIATLTADGWTFDREIGQPSLVAVRFAEGLGWDSDSILYADDGDFESAVRAFLEENATDATIGQTEHVAVGFDEPDVLLTYRAGPPPSASIEALQ